MTSFASVILRLDSSGTAAVGRVGPFDCGRVPGWKIDGPKRIFPGWRQLCNAIAAPSTDALKRSSWYRIRVTRSARSAELLSNRGRKVPTFPHTNFLNVL